MMVTGRNAEQVFLLGAFSSGESIDLIGREA